MLRITEEQVEGSLDISTSIDLTRDAYRLQATGKVLNPSRALLIVPGGVSLYCMPAHVLGSKAIAVKIARVAPDNVVSSLPSTRATLYLYDWKTGECVAGRDAEAFPATRTAARPAVATDEPAREASQVERVC